MAVDENGIEIIDPAIQPTQPKVENRAAERIQQLSDKVELTAKERDDLKTANESTTRERDFYKGFAEVIGTNPAAKDHQDEIKDKVLKGYTVEDATFAVLGKAGKLGQPAQVQAAPHITGGSADTSPQGAQKEVKDMSQAERRAQLEKDLLWS